MNLKNRKAKGLLFLLSVSSIVYAQSEKRIEECSAVYEHNNTGLSSAPKPTNGCGVYITADALIWKAHEIGIGYTAVVSPSNLLAGVGQHPCFKYHGGFRVGLGYTLPRHDAWDVYAYYTQFNSLDFGLTKSTGSQAPVNSGSLVNDLSAVDTARVCWNLKTKFVDVELGRSFFVGNFIKIRPHAGVRGAKINQTLTTTYIITNTSNDVIVGNQKMSGAGLQAGFNFQWNAWRDLSVYSDASFALLASKVRTQAIEAPNFNQIDCLHTTQSMFDLALGLRWERYMCNERLHLQLQAGWEQHLLPNHWFYNQTIGDLTLQGWVISARFDF